MKKSLLGTILAGVLFALPLASIAQIPSYTNTAQAGVSLFTFASSTATATATSRLPTFSGTGTLTVTEAGITGSPSGCTITLAYQGNNSPTATSVVSTTSFTPSTGVQTFAIAPTVASGDNYVAVYACSTYPTAGTLTASFSPTSSGTQTVAFASTAADPCESPNAAKSSVTVAISTATTTQLVALSSGKTVYVCGFTASIGATTTVALEYGTGSSCGTGTTALTGVFAPATGAVLSLGGSGYKTATIASNALCAVSTGTGGINGVLSYVQQ